MIDIRKLKELVRLMVENDLIELDLRDSEEQVTVRRPNAAIGGASGGFAVPQQTVYAPAPMTMSAPTSASRAQPSAPASSGNGASATAQEDAGLLKIESPMVGTFYATPNPDSPPFAVVGTPVSPDKVVCIIEAMKIFNEIKAECTGTIHKVLVKSGDAVEFGQTLFLVKPA